MNLPAPRADIAALPRYIPGARGAADQVPPVKVSSNETPFGPLPSVAEAIARASAQSNRYPDMFAVELTERLASRYNVNATQVVVGGGSVGVLGHILQAYCAPGDEVLFAWRSFEAYPILTRIAGATPVTVPLNREARHDLPAMAAAITPRTKVAIVCSPNNPTGPSIGREEFVAFMASVPPHVLVVLDEAYVEFVRNPATVDGRAVLDGYPNLVVLRTFSKAYGLAGLRVGFALGSEALVAPVRACVTPFSVSTVAQAAAIASLAAESELMERVDAVVAERERVLDVLVAEGWTIPQADGNFYWIAAGERTEGLAGFLSAHTPAILVRPFGGEGIRVSVGDQAENTAVLDAFANYPDRV
ncbi:MAG: histidinol-phosphate transaminase [Actinobacteria bacterium HGW-Actinobacteria-4]|nr:MAG: histidinol-phosphate transaminase [Actinobacteria bacterium HGW-Actinobacteria-4]